MSTRSICFYHFYCFSYLLMNYCTCNILIFALAKGFLNNCQKYYSIQNYKNHYNLRRNILRVYQYNFHLRYLLRHFYIVFCLYGASLYCSYFVFVDSYFFYYYFLTIIFKSAFIRKMTKPSTIPTFNIIFI